MSLIVVAPKIKFGLTFALLFIAVMVAIDLIKSLTVLGWKHLANNKTILH